MRRAPFACVLGTKVRFDGVRPVLLCTTHLGNTPLGLSVGSLVECDVKALPPRYKRTAPLMPAPTLLQPQTSTNHYILPQRTPSTSTLNRSHKNTSIRETSMCYRHCDDRRFSTNMFRNVLNNTSSAVDKRFHQKPEAQGMHTVYTSVWLGGNPRMRR